MMKAILVLPILSFLLFLTLLLPFSSKACIRFMEDPHSQGIYDDKEAPRKTVNSCTCGTGTVSNWALFIHSKTGSNSWTTCLGTIVTSNLVLTSHKCLIRDGSRLEPYHFWSPKPKSVQNPIVPLSDLIVTTSLSDPSGGEQFPVVDIILNPNFAQSMASNDIAILVLKADFTSAHSHHHPVCIPPGHNTDTTDDLSGQPAFLLGPNEPHHEISYLLYHGAYPGTGLHYGGDCGERKYSAKDHIREGHLCLPYYADLNCLIAKQPGSILLSEEMPVTFLLGISTNVVVPPPSGLSRGWIHATNIFPLVKYIEYQAKLRNSQWCTTPDFKLLDRVSNEIKPPAESLCGPWPWTNYVPPPRDESLQCYCGLANQPTEYGRVVGGNTSTPREFGWMVKLRIETEEVDEDGSPEIATCGASLINDRMVLSAAHCFSKEDTIDRTEDFYLPTEGIRVYLDSHRLEGDEQEVRVGVKALYVHPGFIGAEQQGKYEYDIAVIILDKPLRFHYETSRTGAHPLCIPKFAENINFIGLSALVLGWGLTDVEDENTTAELADELQRLEVPIQEMKVCREAVAPTKILDGFLCAGTLDPRKDAAQGDSGGPLMVMERDRWNQAGLVSYGIPNGTVTAALYTDVQKFIPFVEYYANLEGAKWCRY